MLLSRRVVYINKSSAHRAKETPTMMYVTTPEPLSDLPILMLESKVCRDGDVNEWRGRYGLIFSSGLPLLNLWASLWKLKTNRWPGACLVLAIILMI